MATLLNTAFLQGGDGGRAMVSSRSAHTRRPTQSIARTRYTHSTCSVDEVNNSPRRRTSARRSATASSAFGRRPMRPRSRARTAMQVVARGASPIELGGQCRALCAGSNHDSPVPLTRRRCAAARRAAPPRPASTCPRASETTTVPLTLRPNTIIRMDCDSTTPTIEVSWARNARARATTALSMS
jgi:hypothetical protein